MFFMFTLLEKHRKQITDGHGGHGDLNPQRGFDRQRSTERNERLRRRVVTTQESKQDRQKYQCKADISRGKLALDI